MSFKSTLLAGFAALSIAAPAFAGDIEIHSPYARSSSMNAMSGAAFMMIHNNGDAADRLIGVTSPAAKRVELHTHIEDANGVMSMVHVEEGFELPANGKIMMQRGGNHVMFMGLTAPFEQDNTVPVTLIFENAGEMEIEVPVDLERVEAEGESHSHDTAN